MAISYDALTNFIQTGGGNSCDVMTATGNSAPTVTAGPSYVVPKGTPFQLTGSATDPDGDALNLSMGRNGCRVQFCW
jgi:hypothetical protein